MRKKRKVPRKMCTVFWRKQKEPTNNGGDGHKEISAGGRKKEREHAWNWQQNMCEADKKQ